MQRIRIGVTGLAFVFLLVLLGTAIGTSRDDEVVTEADQSVLNNSNAVEPEPTEPLAELGAAPGQAVAEPAGGPPDPTIDSERDVILDELARPSE